MTTRRGGDVMPIFHWRRRAGDGNGPVTGDITGGRNRSLALPFSYKYSATRWFRQLWRGLPLGSILFALPALLLIPALYYSLDTPYAFVDDHAVWYYLDILDGPKRFWQSLVHEFGSEMPRYRPVFIYYAALTWKVYGETMWLHHLTRWAMHFGAVLVWAAALLRFCPGRRSAAVCLVPLGLLVWLWVFFPNSPASRLTPLELPTVFFLGVCTWATALVIRREREGRGAAWWQYGLLYAAYLGLGVSKEINLAVMLWILAFYCGLAVWRAGWRKAAGRLPLLLIFLGTLYRVYGAYSFEDYDDYGHPTIATEVILDNAGWLFRGLFQVETSPYIAVGLGLLAAALLAAAVIPAARRRVDGRWVFIVFLLGQLGAMYLILLTSHVQALRYWYILIPVFTTLLALGARFALEAAEQWRPVWGRRAGKYAAPATVVGFALAGFVVFFIAVNYDNFLYQTIAQHSVRNAEARVIDEIAARHNDGGYVQILENDDEHFYGLRSHFRDFAPYWRGEEYRIHRVPPEDGRPYYAVGWTYDRIPAYPTGWVEARQDYIPQAYAYRVADWLQDGPPHRARDAGVADPDTYGWIIYRRNDTDRMIDEAGPPLVGAHYKVYRTAHPRLVDGLLYVRDGCRAGDDDTAAPFFLHIIPADLADLPEGSRPHGFENRDFTFEERGWREGSRCLAWRQLPDYEIGGVRTGQYRPEQGGERAWEEEFRLGNPPGAP